MRVNEIRSVFPPRGNSSRKFRNELSLFKSRTRHGGFKSQKFRIEFYAGKLPPWKLLSISIQALISNRIQNYPIRLALTKSYEKSQILEFVSRYILEIEIRNRAFQTFVDYVRMNCSLRTPTSILNINYLGDRVEVHLRARVRLIAPSSCRLHVYTYIHNIYIYIGIKVLPVQRCSGTSQRKRTRVHLQLDASLR